MMGRKSLGLALAIALIVSSAAPALPQAANNCAGGGSPRPAEGGIGGTGLRPAEPGEDENEGGIGGTGITVGDIGVIGTVTGFASICVGGVEIHYDAKSVVEIDGAVGEIDQLAVGQVVEVVATGSGDALVAQHIAVDHIVAGPVTRVDSERNELDVIGQTVRLPAAEKAAGDTAERIAPGNFVRINGLRRDDGLIVASLATRGAGEESRLTGPVTRTQPGVLTIAGTAVNVGSDVRVAVGDEVRITGFWDGGTLVATALEPIPRVPFAGRARQIDIEGFAGSSRRGELKVGSFVFDLPPSFTAETMPPPDTRVRVRGIVDDGRAVVERIDFRPPLSPPTDRNGSLRGGNAGPGDPAMPRTERDGGAKPGAPPPRARPDSTSPQPRSQQPLGGSGFDKPDSSTRPHAPMPDRPPQPDRPTGFEKPRLPERPERPERPPRPERPDLRRP